MSEQLWWYVARAGGIVAWALLTASVLWGLALSTKALGGKPRPNWLLDLHRFLGGLALVFTGVHVGALVLDSYVDFGLTQILVPFTSSYRPLAVAWGVVALQLLVAVELTSLLKRKIPKRLWRGVHVAAFPLFAMATIHGLTAGTDSSNILLVVAMWASVLAVAVLTLLRIAQARRTDERPQPARPVPRPPTSATHHLRPPTPTGAPTATTPWPTAPPARPPAPVGSWAPQASPAGEAPSGR